jgi:hypothetical protein
LITGRLALSPELGKRLECVKGLTVTSRDIGGSIVSQKSNEELSIALMATDAIALVESLGWKKVNMLGFSMGGERSPVIYGMNNY